MTATTDRRSLALKGALDLCVLSVLRAGPTYGYGLVTSLQNAGLELVAEGSVYPLLARLKKRGLVRTYLEPSPSGPKRKYYELTDLGRSELNSGAKTWLAVSQQVTSILEGSHERTS